MPMVRGGGGGEVVSGDGLIYPEAFWGRSRDLDTEAIRSSAANLRALGADVSAKTGEISAVWNELPASYVSPEAWRVYTLMGPAVSKADGIEDRFARGAGCLEAFADELDFIRPRLADLEVRANAFRAKALAGVEVTSMQVFPSGEAVQATSTVGWREDTAMVAKNARLLGEYFDLVEQITMSSDTCARGLRILAGTQAWLTAGGGGQVGVITADQLAGAGVLPFGAPVAEDRSCGESIGDGFKDFGKGIVDGAGMLVLGYNPEDGTFWNGDSYGQAWGGLGNLGGSLAVMGMLAVPGVGQVMTGVASRNDAFAGWIDDRSDVVVGAAGSLVGYDHATAQAGGDGWHQWKEDGVRTATTSVLNIGTFFIPGAGAIGGSAKAGSVAAKVGAVASTAAEVIVPGGSWLLKGGASVVRAGEAAVTGGRAATVAADAARLGKAGALTSLDNITAHAGYTPARPRLTDAFNVESVTKPDPSMGAAKTVVADLHDTFGENPYAAPDYIPDEIVHHAEISAPEKAPALIGATAREAGNAIVGHENTVTNSTGEQSGAATSGGSESNHGTHAADSEPIVNGSPGDSSTTTTGNGTSSGNQPPGFDEWDAWESQQRTSSGGSDGESWTEHAQTEADPIPGRHEPYDPFGNEWYDPEIGPTNTPPVITEYTEHVIDRLIKRGITREEVQDLFDNPPRFPEWQPDKGTWRYRSADGEFGIAVSPQGRLVTGFYRE
jgi:hypothetical protein